MTVGLVGTRTRHAKSKALWPLGQRPSLFVAAVAVLAIVPAIAGAVIAQRSGNWDLFERAGSLITAIGLLVASRRYVQYGVLELAALQADRDRKPTAAELMNDVMTAKLGLALSAFGTLIWGWGAYLRWWGFAALAVWAFLAVRDMRRDLKRVSPDGFR